MTGFDNRIIPAGRCPVYPELTLDMASYGIVTVLEHDFGHAYPDMAWEPKVAFTALANSYRD